MLVFALAIMDNAKNSHLEVMKAEVPGPVFGKVVSKLKNTAQILYLLYLALFSLFVIIYYLAGMPLYDSFVIATGTAGTGGFTVYNDGIAHYGSSLITYLVSIGVLVFGVNFNLYYYLMFRRIKAFFGDEELRAYLVIVLVSTGLISLNTLYLYPGFSKSFEGLLPGFQHHYNNWFWIWRYYQLAPLLPVYPPFPHGNRWLCWINCRWTQDYSRPHPFKNCQKSNFVHSISPPCFDSPCESNGD